MTGRSRRGSAVTALPRRDLPVILGVVLTVTIAIVVFNLIVDLLYGWLDPRVRTGTSQADVAEAKGATGQRAPEPVPAPAATGAR